MPVAKHPCALLECGFDDGGNVLSAVGEEEEKLSLRIKLLAVQKDLANGGAYLPRSGLPRNYNLPPLALKGSGQAADERALPSPFRPFEGYEHAGMVPLSSRKD